MKALLALVALATTILAPSALAASTPPSFYVLAGSALDNAASVPVTIIKSAKTNSYSKLQVLTSDGTAKAGVDYVALNTTVTLGNSVTQLSVPVKLIPRPGYQDYRSFTVTIKCVRFCSIRAGSLSTTTVGINDSEPQPAPTPTPPPPVVCPDGTTLPAGSTCPVPPPPVVSSCKPLNMVPGDAPLPTADMVCTAVKMCHDFHIGLVPFVGDPLVQQGQQYYVVRGLLWNGDDQHVVAWVPNGGSFPGWQLSGGAYFDRSCF